MVSSLWLPFRLVSNRASLGLWRGELHPDGDELAFVVLFLNHPMLQTSPALRLRCHAEARHRSLHSERHLLIRVVQQIAILCRLVALHKILSQDYFQCLSI